MPEGCEHALSLLELLQGNPACDSANARRLLSRHPRPFGLGGLCRCLACRLLLCQFLLGDACSLDGSRPLGREFGRFLFRPLCSKIGLP